MICYRSSIAWWLHILHAILLSAHVTKAKKSAKKSAKRFRMLDPVSVGHSQSITLPDGSNSREVKMESLALDPPLFHIKGLLTADEADSLVKIARKKKSKWEHSSDTFDQHKVDQYKYYLEDRDGWLQMLAMFDKDEDQALSEGEMRTIARQVFGIGRYNHTHLLRHHKLPTDKVIIAEKVAYKNDGFLKYFTAVRKKHPKRHMRYSSHTWVQYLESSLANRLKDYVQSITKWPQDLFATSVEDLQVAHYDVGGHFSCHPDATKQATRMTTMIVFLNSPQKGGELVFPGADKPDFATISEEDDFRANCSNWGGCLRMGGVVVKPAKGDAVFWYNMNTDLLKRPGPYPRSDLIIPGSVHCGADVSGGEKYIATVWVNLPPGYIYEEHQRSEL